jgi:hypothetical protein
MPGEALLAAGTAGLGGLDDHPFAEDEDVDVAVAKVAAGHAVERAGLP